MHGLILAGEGRSQLAPSRWPTPTAFVEVGGCPMLSRAVAILDDLGVSTLTCVVRDEHAAAAAALVDGRARILASAGPSSLELLASGFAALPPGPVFCVGVGAMMRADDWHRVFAVAAVDLAGGADAVLAVTPCGASADALYVERGARGRIERISDVPIDPVCVIGGVHGFGDEARILADDLAGRGRDGVRALLRLMVRLGLDVTSTLVPQILDVDRSLDFAAASALTESEGALR